MRKVVTCGLLLALLPLCTAAEPLIPESLGLQARELLATVEASSRAYEWTESLVTEVGPRFAGSDGDRRAVQWALKTLQAAGLKNVRAENVTVPHWQRGSIRADIVSPHPHSLVATALGGSAATPAAGISASVLALQSLDQLEWTPDAEVKGRIVYFNAAMDRSMDGAGYGKVVPLRHRGPVLAARKGAKAVILRSVGTDHDRLAHTGSIRYEPGVPKIPAAAISAPDADLLDRLLARGAVTLRLNIGSRDLGKAVSANVIGEVLGETDEVVLLGAHLDSWDTTPGANDDGAGVGIVIEAARQILATGMKPRRTIRVVLYANEEFGLSGATAYAAAYDKDADQHALAMEADFGSGRVFQLGSRLAAADAPWAQAAAELLGLAPGSNEANGGADLGPLRTYGVPVLEPRQNGMDYFDVHHTANDTLDKIDRAGLAQNAATYAALAWLASQRETAFARLTESQRRPKTLSWKDLAARPLPPAAERIAYGSDALQFGELRVPQGKGPFPVVVLIHGGCWLNAFDYQHITSLAQALTASGIATWTLEFRRIGDVGGGWPGTFLDVGAGTDHLRELAKRHPLDLKRVVSMGHSAGGQLALWLATRDTLLRDSDLYANNPLPLSGVIPLAAISDLKSYSVGAPNSCNSAVAQLLGGMPDEQPARYAQTSPLERLPLTVPVRLLHGSFDSIVPLKQSQDFVAAAKSRSVNLTVLENAGHFEPVSPVSATWLPVLSAVKSLLKMP